jgi:hypothetical protein
VTAQGRSDLVESDLPRQHHGSGDQLRPYQAAGIGRRCPPPLTGSPAPQLDPASRNGFGLPSPDGHATAGRPVSGVVVDVGRQNVKVVAELLGHSSPTITQSIYQHVRPGCRRVPAKHSVPLCWARR